MESVQWLDDRERAAWLALAFGSGRLLDTLERELVSAHGLTLSDYGILAMLSQGGCDGVRMSELAAGALVSRSRLTHRVNRLEDEGLVQRVVCETDRRGFLARLTPKGHERLAAAAPTHVAGLRRHLVGRLERSQLEALTAAFTDIVDGLGETVPAPRPGVGAAPPTSAGETAAAGRAC